ncbi:oxalurate catabolism protein HpxZ [Salinisphaera sp. T31B1]|uniref:oxalurate catabolism protein HpxZ n=1 Tax=Salinisphaera sp. T31B1 TaxID=727963 RepID=UPI00333F1A97
MSQSPDGINRRDVVAEVTDALMRYEAALTGNDVATLDELFWNSEHTVRYGATEMLYGHDEIRAFRKARSPAHLDRRIRRIAITTFGEDFATASIEFEREGEDGLTIGRQSQCWVRFDTGWRVVSAHVSALPNN